MGPAAARFIRLTAAIADFLAELVRDGLFRALFRVDFFATVVPRLRAGFLAADDLRAPDAALFRLAPLDLRAEYLRDELERLPDLRERALVFLDVAMEKAP